MITSFSDIMYMHDTLKGLTIEKLQILANAIAYSDMYRIYNNIGQNL